MQQVRKGIAETLGNTSNPFVGMNAVLRRVVSAMPYGKKDGSIAYKGDIVRFQSGPSSFTVGNLSIANVDSIESLSVLEALNANTTRNSIALGLPMPGLQASMDVSLDFIPGTTPHFTGDKLKADLRIARTWRLSVSN